MNRQREKRASQQGDEGRGAGARADELGAGAWSEREEEVEGETSPSSAENVLPQGVGAPSPRVSKTVKLGARAPLLLALRRAASDSTGEIAALYSEPFGS